MGLMDDLGKAVGGLSGQGAAGVGGAPPALVQAVMGMLSGGGLDALVKGFQQQGLGQIVASWISTGPNLPVSGQQVQQALGAGRIGELAKASGLDAGAVATHLTTLLPALVDKLTPSGAVPQGAALEQGLGVLKGLFK